MYQTSLTIDDNAVTNYQQILPMTFEEKVNMYMKCSKLELAKMLAERDRIEQNFPYPPVIQPVPYPCPYPSIPQEPYYWNQSEITCNTVVTDEDYKLYSASMQKESE